MGGNYEKTNSTHYLIPKGRYYGVIESAEMKYPKSIYKLPQLKLTWNVYGRSGKFLGKITDILEDSDNDFVAFKLRCFKAALGISHGVMFRIELRDLVPIVIGKKCIISVSISSNDGEQKNQINIFDNPPYLPIEAAK